MKRVESRDYLETLHPEVFMGVFPGYFYGCFVGLSAGIAEKNLIGKRVHNQEFCQPYLRFDVVEIGYMNEPLGLFLYSYYHLGWQ